jgi:hypothetical protein
MLLSQTLTACEQKDRLPAAQSSVGSQQTGSRLNHIPPPDRGNYSHVRDARDWQNPYLVIRAEGVEVILKNTSVGRKIITCDELAAYLETLPATAWPYGRVVAAQEIGIRRGDGKDNQRIAENRARVERILTSLGVKVDWWASA